MLSKLSIRNYALIDSLELEFDSGLTIITGETGAGKSIMLGALSMIMGGACGFPCHCRRRIQICCGGIVRISAGIS